VQGLAVTARKLGIPVYFTEPTHRAWMRWMTPRKRLTYADWLEQQKAAVAAGKEPVSAGAEAQDAAEEDITDGKPEKDPCALPGVEYFSAGADFQVGDIAVTSYTVPHDAVDPVGFLFAVEGVRIGIATDLGYIPPNVHLHLKRCDVLMLESNHDVDMLRDGPYPWSVKQRVMSRVGHLSNDAAAEFLEKSYDGQAAYVVLAHMSESNNMPELALVAAERALQDRGNLLGNRLLLARQQAPLESIVL
jgi:phosphoribosyl 1,2-cyclic phosphodiesterase